MVALMLLAEAGGSNLIVPDGSLVLILFLFLIFVFLLNRILFKPIGRVLDERETLTEGAKAEARAAARQCQNQLDEYEAGIRHARGESYRFLEQQRGLGLEQRKHMVDEAKQRAADDLNRAKAEIARQAAEARAALESEARSIAQQISRNVLGRTVGGGGD